MSQPAGRSTRRPVRTSTTAPVLLTVGGVAALSAGVVAVVLAVQTFIGLLPLGILSVDGTAGPDVVASVPVAGNEQVVLAGSTEYALFLARPEGMRTGLAGPVLVAGPDGRAVDVSGTAAVAMDAARGGVVARTVGAFTATAPGTYTVAVPELLDGGAGAVLVAPDQPVLPFVRGVVGTITGLVAGGLLSVLGLGMVVGGALWWRTRRIRQGTT